MEEEFNWDLFESDQKEFDQRYLTGKATYEALLEKESMQEGSIDQHIQTAILFNPFKDDYNAKFPHLHNEVSRTELVEFLIEHFIETEEYEKCADLTKYKASI